MFVNKLQAGRLTNHKLVGYPIKKFSINNHRNASKWLKIDYWGNIQSLMYYLWGG